MVKVLSLLLTLICSITFTLRASDSQLESDRVNLSDRSNYQSKSIPKKSSESQLNEILPEYEIHHETISNEKPKPETPPCFSGAWYHKVFSSKDRWSGIEGTLILPEVDINRYNGEYNSDLAVDPNARNLDNPSIYMGGHATSESDVGLSLSKVQLTDDQGRKRITRGSYVYRPFWRYITIREKDEGGYDVSNGRSYAVSCRESNCIASWFYGDTQFYYLPGDKLRMIVYSPEPDYLQMQIEVISKSTLPESVKIRKENNWKDPADFFSPKFRSPGHGTNIDAEYKQVNAIDQVANEGKSIIHTSSQVKKAVWESTYLYRKIGNKTYRIPLNETRSATMNCPESNRFTHGNIDNKTGGTFISIHPGRFNDVEL